MQKNRIKKGYMCKIDYTFHLEEDINGSKIYPTVEALKNKHFCAEECGIVEVEIKLRKVIKNGDIL